EPNAGSDVANITTRAERRGDRWVLSGGKTWVTNAPVADVLTVAAKTSAERGMKNIALFLLDRSTMRGITLGKKIDKMSVFASEMAVTVTDEAVRIFASYGLAMEYPVQRYFRDARFLLPGGGTSEILRVVIGRDLDWDRCQAFA